MTEKEEDRKPSVTRGGDDFRTLFEQSLRSVRPGGVVRGRVVGITPTHVMVDVGYKSEGQVPLQEFLDRHGNVQVKIGDEIDVFFDSPEGENGDIVLSRERAENIKAWDEVEKACRDGSAVEGMILAKVKGGFKVDVMGLPGFLPGSHVDIRPTRNLDKFVGQKERFAVLKYSRPRGNVVVSRRALMEKERESMKKEVLKVLEEGIILEGVVKNITPYGAFVDLGGIDGILHISDMSWGRINHPSEVVKVGERVKVVVLNVDASHRRISLGLKQVMPNPWEQIKEKYPVGAIIKGPVRNVTDFGVFVGVEEGIDGLVHISDLHWTKKIKHPSELYKKGDALEAKVLGVDVQNERVSLGIKQLTH